MGARGAAQRLVRLRRPVDDAPAGILKVVLASAQLKRQKLSGEGRKLARRHTRAEVWIDVTLTGSPVKACSPDTRLRF